MGTLSQRINIMYIEYLKNLIAKDIVTSVTRIDKQNYTRVVASVMVGELPIEVRRLMHDIEFDLCADPEKMVRDECELLAFELCNFVLEQAALEFTHDKEDM